MSFVPPAATLRIGRLASGCQVFLSGRLSAHLESLGDSAGVGHAAEALCRGAVIVLRLGVSVDSDGRGRGRVSGIRFGRVTLHTVVGEGGVKPTAGPERITWKINIYKEHDID